MNEPYLTMAGIVGSDLRTVVIDDHLPITSFRLGSTTRRYDRSVGGWVDGETTWVTVTCFRGLARNVAKSIAKRDRVVVHGRLRVRLWRRDDGEHRTSVEVEADSVGHDLTFGTSILTRTPRVERVGVPGRAAADELVRAVEEDAENPPDLSDLDTDRASDGGLGGGTGGDATDGFGVFRGAAGLSGAPGRGPFVEASVEEPDEEVEEGLVPAADR
ncbi:MAG: single-stranded DNA-binding protein [Actinomycetales bacterium]|nr:single-stranded DNA-binding protein [Actinomycetales bacterium]